MWTCQNKAQQAPTAASERDKEAPLHFLGSATLSPQNRISVAAKLRPATFISTKITWIEVRENPGILTQDTHMKIYLKTKAWEYTDRKKSSYDKMIFKRGRGTYKEHCWKVTFRKWYKIKNKLMKNSSNIHWSLNIQWSHSWKRLNFQRQHSKKAFAVSKDVYLCPDSANKILPEAFLRKKVY